MQPFAPFNQRKTQYPKNHIMSLCSKVLPVASKTLNHRHVASLPSTPPTSDHSLSHTGGQGITGRPSLLLPQDLCTCQCPAWNDHLLRAFPPPWLSLVTQDSTQMVTSERPATNCPLLTSHSKSLCFHSPEWV